MEEKTCAWCGNTKPLSDFYSYNKVKADGEKYVYYNPECKKCRSERSSKWQNENYESYQKSFHKRNTKPITQERLKVSNEKRRQEGKELEWQRNNPDKVKVNNQYRVMNKKHEIPDEEWEDCKKYFNHRCAYCGLKIEEHYIKFNGKIQLGDFHKEHVNHTGSNDLSNCIPSCKSCNVRKHTDSLEEWYIKSNTNFSHERLNKIKQWLNKDYVNYLNELDNIVL